MTTYSEFIKRYIINIPAIQRDYVQGANVNSKKRDEFIAVILKKLETSEQLGLEFIYGSSKKSEKNDDEYFVPIDGQQRLTTLALLGWMLAQLAYTEQERTSLLLKPMDYSVRSTTQLFVKHLFASDLPHACGEQISDYIKNVPSWFAKKWENDPSICAMLDILDKLYLRLKNKSVEQRRTLADNLFHNGVIVFDLLDMDNYNLTEDLYVKMNARGKHLTDFENWKAEFYGFLKTIYGVEDADKFSDRIEGDWCDLFWDYAKKDWEGREDEKITYPRIDEFFMRFYNYITETLYLSQTDMKKRAEDLKVDISKVLQKDPDAGIFEVYKDRENFDYLFSVLDALVKITRSEYNTIDNWLSKIITKEFDPKGEKINIFAETDIFHRLIYGEEVTLPLRVLFYAILDRIVRYQDESIEETRNYVRVFWGWELSKNWRDRSSLTYEYNIRVENFHDARKIIDELSVCADVFKALEDSSLKELESEKEKASWRKDEGKYDAVQTLSGHPYLKGCLNNIYPSLKELPALDVIDRFIDFTEKNDHDKICALIPYGFRGAFPESNNYRFYGIKDHWDFVFTCPHDSVKNAVTSMLLQRGNKKTFTANEFEYYILKYPRFVAPIGYFCIENDFTVWGLERFTGRRGYNSCPYCRMVVEQMKNSPLKLKQCAEDSSHGSLWSELLGFQMECHPDGWSFQIYDEKKWDKYPQAANFESYRGKVLHDSVEKDRIETAIDFLGKFAIPLLV